MARLYQKGRVNSSSNRCWLQIFLARASPSFLWEAIYVNQSVLSLAAPAFWTLFQNPSVYTLVLDSSVPLFDSYWAIKVQDLFDLYQFTPNTVHACMFWNLNWFQAANAILLSICCRRKAVIYVYSYPAIIRFLISIIISRIIFSARFHDIAFNQMNWNYDLRCISKIDTCESIAGVMFTC